MSQHAIAPIFPSDPSVRTNALSLDETQQLSRILARLGIRSTEPSARRGPALIGENAFDLGSGPLARAKAIYNARQRRARFFPQMMFGEPAWEILLVLYIHDGLARLCIKDVGQLISTPATTILRWVKVLQDENFISVRKYHVDRRVTHLDLTDFGRSRVAAYMEEMAD